MKVYLVTSGSYSDYSVEAVFADKALAEAHQREVEDFREVEEYELVETAPKRIRVYSISNDTYHGRGHRHEWSYEAWDYQRSQYKRADRTDYVVGKFRAVHVVGLDEKAVRKAYDDRIAEIQAGKAGVA